VTLAAWLSRQIENHPVQLSAIFFGLIVGSVLLTKREIKTWDWVRVLWFILGAVAAFVVVGYSSESVSDPSSIIVISAGAVAICAMILPGISGSFILLAFGFYDHLLGAVKDFNVAVLLNYGIGAGIGLALFARGLSWLLRVHREKTLALLIGLMAGSLRVLWPWPSGNGLENATLGRPVTSEVLGAATLSIVALAAVFILTTISRRFE
jgi:putative membrane protein